MPTASSRKSPTARADLLDHVVDFVADGGLWQPGARVLVAVSGGPDSLCLLHLLRRLAPAQRLALHVAHLDHKLRPESAGDARFVAEVAAGWGIPCTVAARDVRPLAQTYGGIEAAARAVRYGFLRETAVAIGADSVATGHNADDQAETVIQRLLRGAGPSGLAGMRPRLNFDQWRGIGTADMEASPANNTAGPALVRPLLATPREAIEAYCIAHGLEPRYDATNLLPEYLRNRVRGYIIPQLKAYNSNIVRALGRTARVCAEEDALLAELLDQQWAVLATVTEREVAIDRVRFTDIHRALRRRALRRAASLVAPAIELGADHLDRMLRLAERPRGRLQLPDGVWMRVAPETISLERAAER